MPYCIMRASELEQMMHRFDHYFKIEKEDVTIIDSSLLGVKIIHFHEGSEMSMKSMKNLHLRWISNKLFNDLIQGRSHDQAKNETLSIARSLSEDEQFDYIMSQGLLAGPC